MPYYLNIFTGLFDYYQTGGVAPAIDGVYLTEASDNIITEAGDYLAWE